MEYAEDIIIVNLEHAYALTNPIKIEQPDEDMKTEDVVIKTEEDISTDEITIKTEPTEDTPSKYPFEFEDVKIETTDFSNVVSEPAVNSLLDPLLEQSTNCEVNAINGHLINNKQPSKQNSRLTKIEINRKKLVQDLRKENRELTKKNQILQNTYKEYQFSAQAKIDTLLEKNNDLQSELTEFYEMKKNYRLLTEQIFSLTKKMVQFMDNTLPNLSSEVIIKDLKTQVNIKNKQHEYVELRVQNLKEAVDRLKQVTTVVKTKQIEDLQVKVKGPLEHQEKNLKDLEKLSFENKLLQNGMKGAREDYKKIKKKYNQSLALQENQKQQINDLNQSLQVANASISQMKIDKAVLNHKFANTIVKMKNKICDYCGM